MDTIAPREPVVPQRPTENEEEIQLGLRNYSARSKLLRDNRSQLTDRYPDQWVGLARLSAFSSGTGEGIYKSMVQSYR